MNLAIIQARVSSTRLPGKVLKLILEKPMLSLQLERIRNSRRIDDLVVATSIEDSDNKIESLCKNMEISCFRGSLDDVLDRFYQAALPYKPEHIVRLTGDCPLIDPQIIDNVIYLYIKGEFDYASNTLEPTFPDGLDVEVFKFSILELACKEAFLPSHREHVTPFIYQHPERFKIGHYKSQADLSHLRWSVDEPGDFDLVRQIYEELYPSNPVFTTKDILDLLDRNSSLCQLNSHIVRNEGMKKSQEADIKFREKNPGTQRSIIHEKD
ncbi:MAG: spore coat protein [Deltaproteobacteria bacterium]|nr:spore coat protein [Deltaproteobacteria bacterium]